MSKKDNLKNEEITTQLKAVHQWLYANKDAISDSGHDILYVDMTTTEDSLSASVICSIDEEELAHTLYSIIKHRFESGACEMSLLKTQLMTFVRHLQLCYENDYAETDAQTIDEALDMIHTAVKEHGEKFHELFDDEDDPELAHNVERALNTLEEIPGFFSGVADDDDDFDDEEFEFDIDDDDDDEDDDEEEYFE